MARILKKTTNLSSNAWSCTIVTFIFILIALRSGFR